jgi:hypothetical protein
MGFMLIQQSVDAYKRKVGQEITANVIPTIRNPMLLGLSARIRSAARG